MKFAAYDDISIYGIWRQRILNSVTISHGYSYGYSVASMILLQYQS
jgi:hypothetical protein